MTKLIINQRYGKIQPVESWNTSNTDSNMEESKHTNSFFMASRSEVAANVYEYENNYALDMLAPGLSNSNIEIDVDDNNILTVQANLDPEVEEEEDEPISSRLEFVSKGFVRSFELPEDALPEEIEMEYNNGILSLIIPKNKELNILILE